MGLFSRRPPPNLPNAPAAYSASFIDSLLSTLRLYFQSTDAIQQINIGGLNIDITTLPTQDDLTTLRIGDAYVDTDDGNALKVKTSSGSSTVNYVTVEELDDLSNIANAQLRELKRIATILTQMSGVVVADADIEAETYQLRELMRIGQILSAMGGVAVTDTELDLSNY